MRNVGLKDVIMLKILTITLFVAACGTLPLKESPKSYNLCTSGVTVFTFNEDELRYLTTENLRNVTVLNCSLIDECGYSSPSEDLSIICERILSE